MAFSERFFARSSISFSSSVAPACFFSSDIAAPVAFDTATSNVPSAILSDSAIFFAVPIAPVILPICSNAVVFSLSPWFMYSSECSFLSNSSVFTVFPTVSPFIVFSFKVYSSAECICRCNAEYFTTIVPSSSILLIVPLSSLAPTYFSRICWMK